jgi:branched-chain amino acid transport system permease protein
MNFSLFFGQAVTGLLAGAGYAVVAIGLSYTLGLARVMNFAFGTFYMLAAFVLSYLMTTYGLHYVVGSILAVLILGVVGWVFSRIVVIRAARVSEAGVMIATLGAGVAMTYGAQAYFGSATTFIAAPLADQGTRIGLASVSYQQILVLCMAPLITLLLDLFMHRTAPGRQIRAVAESPELAAATGVNIPVIQALAVTIGVVLGAIAAVLYAPVNVIWVFMGDEILLKAFAIAALAGIGSLWGALIVGLGVGVFEAEVTAFLSSAYSTAAIYAVLIIMLIVRPKGIFHGH